MEVASFTDAWIETYDKAMKMYQLLSHLLQMRGLKRLFDLTHYHQTRRIFYRCVD